MPKIAQYTPNQTSTQVTRQPTARDAPAAAFGSDIGQGVVDIVQAGAQLKQRVDTTSAEEALVQFEREKNDLFFNPENGYFNTQGRDAYDNSPAATKALDDLKMKFGENLNEQSKFMFDSAADKHITRSQLDITRHASKGLKAWEIATIEAQTENSLENASLYWNDKDGLKVQNVLGRQAILDSAKLMGLSPEATNEKVQTFESMFAKNAITSAIQSSAAEGKELMKTMGDRLEGPDKVKIEGIIEKKEKIEKTEADARQAVLTATRLLNQYEDRADMLDEVEKIEDPELRKKTLTELTTQFNQRKNAEKELENNNYQAAISLVNDGMTPVQIQAQDPDAWWGMSDRQRNNILSGKHVITDQILFNRLLSLPTRDLAKVNPTDHAANLRPADLQKLTTAVNKAKKGKPGSRVKSLSAKSMQAAEGAFGNKSKWKNESGGVTERGKKANQFLSDLQDAIDEFEESNNGRMITPAEEDKLIGEFTRQVVVERSAFGFDILAEDTEIDLSNTPPGDVRVLNKIIDNTPNIDVTDLVDAYQFLVDEGEDVTAAKLRNVYDQGRQ